jgi:molybdopterin-guanine dinucleotide biosynthesis protein A
MRRRGAGSARVAAAILAGGRAERLHHANKAALAIGAERILDRQVRVLRGIADPVFVVSTRADVGGNAASLAVTVVPDAFPGAGPLGGIYTAIAATPAARTLVVACDMPFLSADFLRFLTRERPAQVVVPRSARGLEPMCAVWTRDAAAAIRRRLESGDLAIRAVLEDLRVEEIAPGEVAPWDPHGLLFLNVNTPRDYERAREGLRLLRNG